MRNFSNHTPTVSRRHSFFSNFKNSKRVRWSEARHYTN